MRRCVYAAMCLRGRLAPAHLVAVSRLSMALGTWMRHFQHNSHYAAGTGRGAQGPHAMMAATIVVQHVAACIMASQLVVRSATARCCSSPPPPLNTSVAASWEDIR
jgi:hypothetical protein